jgi:hypothetical protein
MFMLTKVNGRTIRAGFKSDLILDYTETNIGDFLKINEKILALSQKNSHILISTRRTNGTRTPL